NYIIRITKDLVANQIYGIREYYVTLRRDWSNGSKLIFVKKIGPSDDDAFIGSGIIDKTIELNELGDVSEKQLWIENNYYKKIVFGKLVIFHPPLLVKDTQISEWSQTAALLHGAQISTSEISLIEGRVNIKIIL
ncbi:MAG TPA: hypothetical protein VE076_13780, partial [Nitrososphaeraceae archaeon]|nr:hypothetical protein [Nitrososphaeraceae archaeon]